MKRVLITGSSGFIGSYLVQNLKGFEIKTLSLRNPDWINQPLECDVVLHCAGIAHATSKIPEETYFRVNCELTKELLNKAFQEKVHQFVFLSTILVFGEGHVGAISIDLTPTPTNAYGRSKVCAETNLLGDNLPIPTLIIRLPLVLGNNPKGNVARLGRLAHFIPFVLNTHNKRSVLTLDHLVDRLQGAINDECSGIVHWKSKDVSTSELFAMLRPRRTWIIPFPKSFIVFLRPRNLLFEKLFGDDYYV
jgi:UDP-glucose 4-epimerase